MSQRNYNQNSPALGQKLELMDQTYQKLQKLKNASTLNKFLTKELKSIPLQQSDWKSMRQDSSFTL